MAASVSLSSNSPMRTPLLPWLFFIVIYSAVLLNKDTHVVSGQCLSDDQQSLLLQLKDSLIFKAEISKVLVQWNQSSIYCTWEGIKCHEGCVTGLKLNNEAISGGVDENSTLFKLIHLESLDLSFNNFNSVIPSKILNLRNLSNLNFSYSGFVGQIPEEISRLIRLVTLDFSSLSFLQPPSLKLERPNLRMIIQNLTEIEELYLEGVNISEPGNEWCPALASSLPNLRVLSLSECHLSGPLDQSLQKLHTLSVIRLNNNNLSAPVPGFFANFSNMASLSLGMCGLHGTFPKEILQVPTLQTLDISYNMLLYGSLPEFSSDNAIQKLVVSFTNFSGRLPTSIGNLQKLSRLELTNCHFDGTLPNSMTKLTQLIYLDLSLNNFTGPIPSFNMSKSLSRIQLSRNCLTGGILSAHWEGLLNLVDVDLRYNFLIGSIPSSLFALPSIQKIQLSHNQFSGQIFEYPSAASSMLDTLDLSSNNLQGPIPMSIFKFRKLSSLWLSFNNFSGTVRLDMFQSYSTLSSLDLLYNSLSVDDNGFKLSSLRTIILSSCKLTAFPYLKDQPNLIHVDLSDNQIYGVIPNWIWKAGNGRLSHLNLSHNHLVGMQEPYYVPNLSILDLHSNELQGKIPALPPFANYIDFSSNYFTSSIPTNIGNNLSTTIFFSLSNNNLTGVIPESICSAFYLQVLDLSTNNLSGRLPACMAEMTQNLGVLNVRRNGLSGTIPNAFPANCSLDTLDLNQNVIEGRVPDSLANCAKLEVLNLGSNMLVDKFPSQLKSISTLRVLVLRANKFYGQIGCSNMNGTWKVLQIFDLSHNNFVGELPGPCLTKWQAMVAGEESKLNHLQFSFLKLTSLYYLNAVTVTLKGREMELVKIHTLFTSIDLSCNNFQGNIPKEMGQLKSLHVLDLSNNSLRGQIPSSLGDMQQLESLDLSRNHFDSRIPDSLAKLNFLSFLNVSYNQLSGRIPAGNQIQTFPTASFQGNKGLCGQPLMLNCADDVAETLPKTPKAIHSNSDIKIKWDLISAETGFIVGFGIVVGPLVFSRKWRKRYFDHVEDIAFSILSQPLQRKWLLWNMSLQ